MPATRCTAFAGDRLIASGELRHVALKAKQAHDAASGLPVQVFDDRNGRLIALPLDASDAALVRSIAEGTPPPPADAARRRGRGRPRLGVQAREVTLLPEHWDWLAAQPGGASLALRRLVEEASGAPAGEDPPRAAQAAAYRFVHAVGRQRTGYAAIVRALFAGERTRYEDLLQAWPDDLREHATMLAADAFAD